MTIQPTDFDNLFILQLNSITDVRGNFVKTINRSNFIEAGLDWAFQESYYSTSHKNVLRGMHFQLPPYDHVKLVFVTRGKILDVALDIRKSSRTFGKWYAVELEPGEKAVYIGKGFCHGFLALEDQSTVEYHTSTEYSKEHDTGIKWNSFGFDWSVPNPICSQRDELFDDFNPLATYFQ